MLGGAALVVPAFAETALWKQGSAQSDIVGPAKALFDNSGSIVANDPNLPVEPVDSLGTRELFFKMLLAVLLVVVLGVAIIYISKKFLPSITNLSGKKVRIVETVHLGPRKTVHLLRVGNQQLLIGSTSDSITMLADVTNASADLSAQETDNNENINGWQIG